MTVCSVALITGLFFGSSYFRKQNTIPIPSASPHQFSTHSLGTGSQWTESSKKELCFLSSTSTLSIIAHRKCFCYVSNQQFSMDFLVSVAIPKILISTANRRASIAQGGSTEDTCASAPGCSWVLVPASSRQQRQTSSAYASCASTPCHRR